MVMAGTHEGVPAAKIISFRAEAKLEDRIPNFHNTVFDCKDLHNVGGISIVYQQAGQVWEMPINETLGPLTTISRKHAHSALVAKYGVPPDSSVTGLKIKSIGEIPLT